MCQYFNRLENPHLTLLVVRKWLLGQKLRQGAGRSFCRGNLVPLLWHTRAQSLVRTQVRKPLVKSSCSSWLESLQCGLDNILLHTESREPATIGAMLLVVYFLPRKINLFSSKFFVKGEAWCILSFSYLQSVQPQTAKGGEWLTLLTVDTRSCQVSQWRS